MSLRAARHGLRRQTRRTGCAPHRIHHTARDCKGRHNMFQSCIASAAPGKSESETYKGLSHTRASDKAMTGMSGCGQAW